MDSDDDFSDFDDDDDEDATIVIVKDGLSSTLTIKEFKALRNSNIEDLDKEIDKTELNKEHSQVKMDDRGDLHPTEINSSRTALPKFVNIKDSVEMGSSSVPQYRIMTEPITDNSIPILRLKRIDIVSDSDTGTSQIKDNTNPDKPQQSLSQRETTDINKPVKDRIYNIKPKPDANSESHEKQVDFQELCKESFSDLLVIAFRIKMEYNGETDILNEHLDILIRHINSCLGDDNIASSASHIKQMVFDENYFAACVSRDKPRDKILTDVITKCLKDVAEFHQPESAATFIKEFSHLVDIMNKNLNVPIDLNDANRILGEKAFLKQEECDNVCFHVAVIQQIDQIIVEAATAKRPVIIKPSERVKQFASENDNHIRGDNEGVKYNASPEAEAQNDLKSDDKVTDVPTDFNQANNCSSVVSATDVGCKHEKDNDSDILAIDIKDQTVSDGPLQKISNTCKIIDPDLGISKRSLFSYVTESWTLKKRTILKSVENSSTRSSSPEYRGSDSGKDTFNSDSDSSSVSRHHLKESRIKAAIRRRAIALKNRRSIKKESKRVNNSEAETPPSAVYHPIALDDKNLSKNDAHATEYRVKNYSGAVDIVNAISEKPISERTDGINVPLKPFYKDNNSNSSETVAIRDISDIYVQLSDGDKTLSVVPTNNKMKNDVALKLREVGVLSKSSHRNKEKKKRGKPSDIKHAKSKGDNEDEMSNECFLESSVDLQSQESITSGKKGDNKKKVKEMKKKAKSEKKECELSIPVELASQQSEEVDVSRKHEFLLVDLQSQESITSGQKWDNKKKLKEKKKKTKSEKKEGELMAFSTQAFRENYTDEVNKRVEARTNKLKTEQKRRKKVKVKFCNPANTFYTNQTTSEAICNSRGPRLKKRGKWEKRRKTIDPLKTMFDKLRHMVSEENMYLMNIDSEPKHIDTTTVCDHKLHDQDTLDVPSTMISDNDELLDKHLSSDVITTKVSDGPQEDLSPLTFFESSYDSYTTANETAATISLLPSGSLCLNQTNGPSQKKCKGTTDRKYDINFNDTLQTNRVDYSSIGSILRYPEMIGLEFVTQNKDVSLSSYQLLCSAYEEVDACDAVSTTSLDRALEPETKTSNDVSDEPRVNEKRKLADEHLFSLRLKVDMDSSPDMTTSKQDDIPVSETISSNRFYSEDSQYSGVELPNDQSLVHQVVGVNLLQDESPSKYDGIPYPKTISSHVFFSEDSQYIGSEVELSNENSCSLKQEVDVELCLTVLPDIHSPEKRTSCQNVVTSLITHVVTPLKTSVVDLKKTQSVMEAPSLDPIVTDFTDVVSLTSTYDPALPKQTDAKLKKNSYGEVCNQKDNKTVPSEPLATESSHVESTMGIIHFCNPSLPLHCEIIDADHKKNKQINDESPKSKSETNYGYAERSLKNRTASFLKRFYAHHSTSQSYSKTDDEAQDDVLQDEDQISYDVKKKTHTDNTERPDAVDKSISFRQDFSDLEQQKKKTDTDFCSLNDGVGVYDCRVSIPAEKAVSELFQNPDVQGDLQHRINIESSISAFTDMSDDMPVPTPCKPVPGDPQFLNVNERKEYDQPNEQHLCSVSKVESKNSTKNERPFNIITYKDIGFCHPKSLAKNNGKFLIVQAVRGWTTGNIMQTFENIEKLCFLKSFYTNTFFLVEYKKKTSIYKALQMNGKYIDGYQIAVSFDASYSNSEKSCYINYFPDDYKPGAISVKATDFCSVKLLMSTFIEYGFITSTEKPITIKGPYKFMWIIHFMDKKDALLAQSQMDGRRMGIAEVEVSLINNSPHFAKPPVEINGSSCEKVSNDARKIERLKPFNSIHPAAVSLHRPWVKKGSKLVVVKVVRGHVTEEIEERFNSFGTESLKRTPGNLFFFVEYKFKKSVLKALELNSKFIGGIQVAVYLFVSNFNNNLRVQFLRNIPFDNRPGSILVTPNFGSVFEYKFQRIGFIIDSICLDKGKNRLPKATVTFMNIKDAAKALIKVNRTVIKGKRVIVTPNENYHSLEEFMKVLDEVKKESGEAPLEVREESRTDHDNEVPLIIIDVVKNGCSLEEIIKTFTKIDSNSSVIKRTALGFSVQYYGVLKCIEALKLNGIYTSGSRVAVSIDNSESNRKKAEMWDQVSVDSKQGFIVVEPCPDSIRADIELIFKDFGWVTSYELNKQTDRVFISYMYLKDAYIALRKMDGKYIGKHKIKVSPNLIFHSFEEFKREGLLQEKPSATDECYKPRKESTRVSRKYERTRCDKSDKKSKPEISRSMLREAFRQSSKKRNRSRSPEKTLRDRSGSDVGKRSSRESSADRYRSKHRSRSPSSRKRYHSTTDVARRTKRESSSEKLNTRSVTRRSRKESSSEKLSTRSSSEQKDTYSSSTNNISELKRKYSSSEKISSPVRLRSPRGSKRFYSDLESEKKSSVESLRNRNYPKSSEVPRSSNRGYYRRSNTNLRSVRDVEHNSDSRNSKRQRIFRNDTNLNRVRRNRVQSWVSGEVGSESYRLMSAFASSNTDKKVDLYEYRMQQHGFCLPPPATEGSSVTTAYPEDEEEKVVKNSDASEKDFFRERHNEQYDNLKLDTPNQFHESYPKTSPFKEELSNSEFRHVRRTFSNLSPNRPHALTSTDWIEERRIVSIEDPELETKEYRLPKRARLDSTCTEKDCSIDTKNNIELTDFSPLKISRNTPFLEKRSEIVNDFLASFNLDSLMPVAKELMTDTRHIVTDSSLSRKRFEHLNDFATSFNLNSDLYQDNYRYEDDNVVCDNPRTSLSDTVLLNREQTDMRTSFSREDDTFYSDSSYHKLIHEASVLGKEFQHETDSSPERDVISPIQTNETWPSSSKKSPVSENYRHTDVYNCERNSDAPHLYNDSPYIEPLFSKDIGSVPARESWCFWNKVPVVNKHILNPVPAAETGPPLDLATPPSSYKHSESIIVDTHDNVNTRISEPIVSSSGPNFTFPDAGSTDEAVIKTQTDNYPPSVDRTAEDLLNAQEIVAVTQPKLVKLKNKYGKVVQMTEEQFLKWKKRRAAKAKV